MAFRAAQPACATFTVGRNYFTISSPLGSRQEVFASRAAKPACQPAIFNGWPDVFASRAAKPACRLTFFAFRAANATCPPHPTSPRVFVCISDRQSCMLALLFACRPKVSLTPDHLAVRIGRGVFPTLRWPLSQPRLAQQPSSAARRNDRVPRQGWCGSYCMHSDAQSQANGAFCTLRMQFRPAGPWSRGGIQVDAWRVSHTALRTGSKSCSSTLLLNGNKVTTFVEMFHKQPGVLQAPNFWH